MKTKSGIPIKKGRKRSDGWRYIVIRKTTSHSLKGKRWMEHTYQIHEAYQFDKNEIPELWTKEPKTPYGESINDLRWALSMMLADSLRMPVYEERGNKLIKRTPKKGD